uniref:Uncharacterized protein n=1 Tax=viral metagenome TaxID=1070528 RepID=A0A6C0JPK8_9ZZZZ
MDYLIYRKKKYISGIQYESLDPRGSGTLPKKNPKGIQWKPELLFVNLKDEIETVEELLKKVDLLLVVEDEFLCSMVKFLNLTNENSEKNKNIIKAVWLYIRENEESLNIIDVVNDLETVKKDKKALYIETILDFHVPRVNNILKTLAYSRLLEDVRDIKDLKIKYINDVINHKYPEEIIDDRFEDIKATRIIIKESECRILILTKIKPKIMFFREIKSIKIRLSKFDSKHTETMQYKILNFNIVDLKQNLYRNDSVYSNVKDSMNNGDIYIKSFLGGEGVVNISVKEYFTEIFFQDSEWNYDEQKEIVTQLFENFIILGCRKIHIRVDFSSKSKINVGDIFIILDLITSGDNSHHFYMNELKNVTFSYDEAQNKKKKELEPKIDISVGKTSFYIYNIKVNIIKSIDNIVFRIEKPLNSTIHLEFIQNVLNELITNYDIKYNDIKLFYKSLLTTKLVPKVDMKKVKIQKTKQLISKLRESDTRFDVQSYTNRCQKIKQPHVSDSLDEFKDQIKKDLIEKKNFWRKKLELKDDQELSITTFLDHPKFQLEMLYWKFPDTDKIYHCIPRDNPNEGYFYPSSSNDIDLPCCNKIYRAEVKTDKNVIKANHIFAAEKLLKDNRKGHLPEFLAGLDSKDLYNREKFSFPYFKNILLQSERNYGATDVTIKDIMFKNKDYLNIKTKDQIDKIIEWIDEDSSKIDDYIRFITFLIGKNIIMFKFKREFNSNVIEYESSLMLFEKSIIVISYDEDDEKSYEVLIPKSGVTTYVQDKNTSIYTFAQMVEDLKKRYQITFV